MTNTDSHQLYTKGICMFVMLNWIDCFLGGTSASGTNSTCRMVEWFQARKLAFLKGQWFGWPIMGRIDIGFQMGAIILPCMPQANRA